MLKIIVDENGYLRQCDAAGVSGDVASEVAVAVASVYCDLYRACPEAAEEFRGAVLKTVSSDSMIWDYETMSRKLSLELVNEKTAVMKNPFPGEDGLSDRHI